MYRLCSHQSERHSQQSIAAPTAQLLPRSNYLPVADDCTTLGCQYLVLLWSKISYKWSAILRGNKNKQPIPSRDVNLSYCCPHLTHSSG